jgi:aspartyl-tRNA(Asn)/glutamyl-tRNA(Gln) amidotransferase subunit C
MSPCFDLTRSLRSLRSIELIALRPAGEAGLAFAGRALGADVASLSRDDVVHVAHLARLDLTDAEIDEFTGQLAAVLDHAASVAAVDTAGVPPTAHPLPLVNVLRDDIPVPSLDREEVLAAAPAVEANRFKVPPILGEAP